MSALTGMTQNDSGLQDVPADYYIDDDMALFNLSKLSGSDLLPDELPHQVGFSFRTYNNTNNSICIAP